jgi:hypothetical protein
LPLLPGFVVQRHYVSVLQERQTNETRLQAGCTIIFCLFVFSRLLPRKCLMVGVMG